MRINFIMGITCSGKDALVEYAQEQNPSTVGLIQVGKEMRKRHPPEYFKGLGALNETEPETWEIVTEQLKLCSEKDTIFVTGMPRLLGQIDKFFGLFNSADCKFWLLYCSEHNIMKRLKERFKDKPDWGELALKRINNDKIQLFDVLAEVQRTHKIISLANNELWQRDMHVRNIMGG